MAKGTPRHSDDLTPRPSTLRRDMTTWSYAALKDLFDGTDEFALYVTEADHEAVFFHAHDRPWLFCRPPSSGWDQAAPEVIEDWIGSLAEKEVGAEPVLMHHDELPERARSIIEATRRDPPEHAYDRLERVLDS